MTDISAITHALSVQPFCIMGILNVTPDSFYDGGRHERPDLALDHAKKLMDEGADLIDIGGASSRPGSAGVPPGLERERVLPVVEAAARLYQGRISVDTTDAGVASAALEAGAAMINDITAGRADPHMGEVVARAGCMVTLMHSRGTPQTMQQLAQYGNVVADVKEELLAAVEQFIRNGVKADRIVIDPGIGFAKTAEQNIALVKGLGDLVSLGYPVMAGTSRKSFIGRLTGRNEPGERLAGTLGSVAAAFMRGVRIFRAHDVKETRDFLMVLDAIERHGALDRVR